MANTITRNIANKIRKAKYFSLMADDVTDVSNREQVLVCMRWVDGEMEPHEDFLGLYNDIQSDTIVAILRDILKHLNLTQIVMVNATMGPTTLPVVRVVFQPNLARRSHVLSIHIVMGMYSILQ